MQRRSFQIAGVILLCLVTAWYVVGDPRFLFVKWDDFSGLPFTVKNRIELATTRGWIKRSSLSLTCTPGRSLRFVLRTRMPERDYLKNTTKGQATLVSQCARTNLTFDVEVARGDFIDEVISSPLSPEQVNEIVTWCGGAYESDNKVSFMTMERGVYLSGMADEGAVRKFSLYCH